ncbi:MAG: hypothetical protein QGG71_23615 [Pirellulaceae bacterium]|jgi:hypothetical protein|nr:hypothetical protein [Pirellulaceae bacterium]
MKKLPIADLMTRLSVIPGFGFLHTWLQDYRGTRTRVDQRVGDLKNYYVTAKGAGSEIAGGVSGEDDEDTDSHDDFAGDGSRDDSDFY